MLLVADSGSTKTDWRLIDHRGELHKFSTIGFNPFFVDTADIIEELEKTLVYEIQKEVALFKRGEISGIFFYGAGCSSRARQFIVEKALNALFPEARIEVEHDLLGAARALCGRGEGIAAILGTGSNSCMYDGEKIIANIGGIGYILGDEGSGAYLGKHLVRAFMYNDMPETLHSSFIEQYGLSKDNIMEAVYMKPNPNRFLASFSKFIFDHIDEDFIHDLVLKCFGDFLDRNIAKYPRYKEMQLGCVGSVGYHYSHVLKEAAAARGIGIGKLVPSPIDELVDFHLHKVK